MTQGAWSQVHDASLAAFESTLFAATNQTVFQALLTATGDATTALSMAPMFANAMVGQFAPAFIDTSLASTLDTIQSTTTTAGAIAVGIFTNSIGALLWFWAYRDTKRLRAGLMLFGSICGVIFNSMTLAAAARPDWIYLPFYMSLTTIGGISVISLLSASLHSATFFWSNVVRRKIFLIAMTSLLWALLICYLYFVGVDMPACGYHLCTARSKYFLSGIPSVFAVTFFGFWVKSIWVAQRHAIGASKGTILNIARWTTVCGLITCLLYLGVVFYPANPIIALAMYGFVPWFEFAGDYGARFQKVIQDLYSSRAATAETKSIPATRRSPSLAVRPMSSVMVKE